MDWTGARIGAERGLILQMNATPGKVGKRQWAIFQAVAALHRAQMHTDSMDNTPARPGRLRAHLLMVEWQRDMGKDPTC